MKNAKFILLFIVSLFASAVKAQEIENVIVEKYYVSDSADATDILGGRMLAKGSTTYRVYIDLVPGAKIKMIYGDINHALKIASDSIFFNNINNDFGKTFGYEIKTTLFKNNPTLPLDSWLTLGMATTKHAGILKSEDPINPPSLIGGAKSGGLLVNDDPAAGIPLNSADGLTLIVPTPPIPIDNGFKDALGEDTTVFGAIKMDSLFITYDAFLKQNTGTMGTTFDNKVLVAQLTTKGTIRFELNLEIMDSIGKVTKYVARKGADSTLTTVKLNSYLKYPADAPTCGCKDPNFLEYNANYSCDRTGACINAIVFGCMDTLACNYDATANFSVPNLCCYPGHCNDRDLSVVCPKISNTVAFNFYPNPVQELLNLQILAVNNISEIKYSIYNLFGVTLMEKNLGILSGIVNEQLDVSNLDTGLHMIRLSVGGTFENKLFMKD